MTARLKQVGPRALAWAQDFLRDYKTVPREHIRAYAQGLLDRSLTIDDPEESLWAAARGEALKKLVEEKKDENH